MVVGGWVFVCIRERERKMKRRRRWKTDRQLGWPTWKMVIESNSLGSLMSLSGKRNGERPPA